MSFLGYFCIVELELSDYDGSVFFCTVDLEHERCCATKIELISFKVAQNYVKETGEFSYFFYFLSFVKAGLMKYGPYYMVCMTF